MWNYRHEIQRKEINKYLKRCSISIISKSWSEKNIFQIFIDLFSLNFMSVVSHLYLLLDYLLFCGIYLEDFFFWEQALCLLYVATRLEYFNPEFYLFQRSQFLCSLTFMALIYYTRNSICPRAWKEVLFTFHYGSFI